MRRLLTILGLVGAALALAACGSSSDSSSGGSSYGGGEASSTSAAGTAAKGGPVTQLTAKDFSYTPTTPSLAAGGATLHVTNSGAVEHNLTVEGLNVDKDLESGKSDDVDVSAEPGSYDFHCKFHPTTMKGTITVP